MVVYSVEIEMFVVSAEVDEMGILVIRGSKREYGYYWLCAYCEKEYTDRYEAKACCSAIKQKRYQEIYQSRGKQK